MLSNLAKVTILVIALMLVAIFLGRVTPAAANAPQSAPPTVVLPTPAVTRTPPRATPAAPAAPVRVAATPTKPAAQAPARPRGPNFYYTYSAGFQIQNLSSSIANITITYYNQDGTVNMAPTDTIPANGSKTYATIAPAAGFNGSVVVSSDQALAAITNVQGTGGPGAWASYDGATSGNSTVSVPLLMKGNFGFNTWFNVQNAGSSDATVGVAYSDGTTAGPFTIKSGAAKTFDQATETHSATVFSGVVSNSSTNQPLVVAVMQEDSATLGAYNGIPSGSTNPAMPLINSNNFGFVTGAQIMNLGGSATSVTVSYIPSTNGTACTETMDIPANSSATFALYAFTFAGPPPGSTGWSTTCARGPTFIGTARVTANSTSQPLAPIVSQLLPGADGALYNGFNTSTATNKVVFPLIMDRNFGFNTGFGLMNVGSASTSVTCTFTGSSVTVGPTVLAANASITQVQTGAIANGYVGSAVCTATNPTDKIVGIVNELGSGAGDLLLVYEGINQ